MTKERAAFRGWVSIGGGALALFIQSGAAIYSFGVFLPELCRQGNWSRGDVSVAYSICMMLITLCAPLAGFLIAKYGVRTAIFIGNLLVAVALLGLSFHWALWQLYSAYAVVGFGAGLAGMVSAGALASNWFTRRAPLAMSIITGSGGIGGLVLVPLITLLIGGMGWRHTYIVLCGLVMALGTLVPLALIRSRPEDIGAVPEENDLPANHGGDPQGAAEGFTLKEAMGTKVFWVLTTFGCTGLFIFVFFTAHQIAYFTSVGLSKEMAALTMGIMSGSTVLGTILIGVLSLKYGLKALSLVSAGAVIVAIILALMTRSVSLAVAFSVVYGSAFGAGLVCFMSLLSAYFGRTHFSKIFGVSAVFCILGTLGAPVGGFLFDARGSYVMPLLIVLGAALAGLICMSLAKRPLWASKADVARCGEGLG
jgi:MFS family permease